ncbi:PadR family transcriptional regulator [Streptomyces chartreusis]|uniref:PadR family transcriptional regulator n=1 Tax=Streptomyces chartreusis TaxID=1969 RepID=UPI00364189FC
MPAPPTLLSSPFGGAGLLLETYIGATSVRTYLGRLGRGSRSLGRAIVRTLARTGLRRGGAGHVVHRSLPGTVSPILDRLAEHGWVTSREETPPHPGRPARRFYELTGAGRQKATAALEDRRVRRFELGLAGGAS